MLSIQSSSSTESEPRFADLRELEAAKIEACLKSLVAKEMDLVKVLLDKPQAVCLVPTLHKYKGVTGSIHWLFTAAIVRIAVSISAEAVL